MTKQYSCARLPDQEKFMEDATSKNLPSWTVEPSDPGGDLLTYGQWASPITPEERKVLETGNRADVTRVAQEVARRGKAPTQPTSKDMDDIRNSVRGKPFQS